MHCTTEREIGFHIPLQRAELGALSTELPDEQRVVIDFVDNDEPVSGRRFRTRTVRPKFGEHARVVTAWHDLRHVGRTRHRVDGITLAAIAAIEVIVKLIEFADVGRVLLNIAKSPRRYIDHDAIVGVEMRSPD